MGSSAEGRRRLATVGFLCALSGAVGIAFKAILVKAAYRYGVDAVTLLALRMLYSLPLFLAMGLSRRAVRRRARRRATWPSSHCSAASATTRRAISISSACSTSRRRSSG